MEDPTATCTTSKCAPHPVPGTSRKLSKYLRNHVLEAGMRKRELLWAETSFGPYGVDGAPKLQFGIGQPTTCRLPGTLWIFNFWNEVLPRFQCQGSPEILSEIVTFAFKKVHTEDN